MAARAVAVGALLLSMMVGTPAMGQPDETPDPIAAILDFVQAPDNQEWVAQFTTTPEEGVSVFADPPGDFEHSTGRPPGFTPEQLDIREAYVGRYVGVTDRIFTPSDDSGIWQVGPNQLGPSPLGNFSDPLFVYTTDSGPHDGTQYADGAWLFRFELAGMPQPMPAGRCEFVVWIDDAGIDRSFENHPSFPGDPAGGSNLAFGLGYNPENAEGLTGTFTLRLTQEAFFDVDPEVDVRAAVLGDQVDLLVPMGAIDSPAGINFYTFCAEKGFSFDPETSGADQTGMLPINEDGLATYEIALQSVATTTSSTTTTTAATTTTTPTTTGPPTTAAETATTQSTAAPVTTGGDGFPWGLVLLGGGLILALVGWLLYRKGGDPCGELLKAWQAAQADCDRLRQEAADAREKCDDAIADLDDLEEERKELCQLWPPACWDEGDGGWIEDDRGNRITQRDLHMRRMALGQVWDDYRAGKISAQEVEAKWREADTPRFREEMREKDVEARGDLAQLDAVIGKAKAKKDEACGAVAKAEAAADAACTKAGAARQAYEKCVGKAMTPPAPAGGKTGGGEGGEAGTPGPSGPATTTEDAGDQGPCQEGSTRNQRVIDRIDEDLQISYTCVYRPQGMHGAQDGSELAADLNDLANTLGFVGTLLGAGGAGSSLKQGNTWAAAGQTGATGFSAGTNIPVPTSLPEAVTAGLQGVAWLGSVVASAADRWASQNDLVDWTRGSIYRHVTLEWVEIEVCHGGEWKCVRELHATWGAPFGRPRARTERDLLWGEIRRRADRWERIQRNRIRTAAAKVKAFEDKYQAGPC